MAFGSAAHEALIEPCVRGVVAPCARVQNDEAFARVREGMEGLHEIGAAEARVIGAEDDNIGEGKQGAGFLGIGGRGRVDSAEATQCFGVLAEKETGEVVRASGSREQHTKGPLGLWFRELLSGGQGGAWVVRTVRCWRWRRCGGRRVGSRRGGW